MLLLLFKWEQLLTVTGIEVAFSLDPFFKNKITQNGPAIFAASTEQARFK